jgi:hypothetical protein
LAARPHTATHGRHATAVRHHGSRHHRSHHAARHHRPATGSGRSHPQPTGPIKPTKGESLPGRGGTATSLNWAGYAVTPGSGITAVSSSFVVPTAGLIPPGFAATWTGIGGYSTSDLIQAGVAEQSLPSNPLTGPQYYPWYEMLPDSAVQLTNCTGDASCTVTPGDRMTVTITRTATGAWKISEVDAGHWSWQSTFNYASTGSSAEWILEAPTVGAQTVLAGVGTAHFGPTSTYTRDGVTRTIAQGDPTQITLSPLPVAGLLDEATPSPLAADGQSFDVCAYQTSCS